MEKPTTLNKGKIDAKYLVKSVIGIAIMLLGQFLTPFAPITECGMAVLFEFIGLIFLWSFVDMMWPTFVAIVLFGINALVIYPNSWQLAGIYEADQQSFGNWIVVFVMCALILCYALEQCGSIRRLCLWFVTRKFARKNPWTFTFMLLLSGLIISLFLDVLPAQFFMLAIAHEMFEILGFKKGDAWPRMVVIGVTFTVIIGFAITPICHTLPILWMSIYSAMTGVPSNMLGYMAVGVPIGVVIWLIMFLWFRFFVKPDVSQLENMDFSKIEALRPGKMGKREKWIVVTCLVVLVLWLIPGFLSFLAPTSALYTFMARFTDTTPLMLGIAFLALIRIDGEPLLDLPKAFSGIAWLPIVLLAGIMMVAGAMGEQSTGIPAFISTYIVPLASGLSPFLLVGVIAVMCIILTNVANNVPVGIIFVSIGVPLAQSLGMNPVLIAIAVCIGADLAFTIPPAYAPVGVAYADPWCTGKAVFKNGLVMTLVCCVICFLLIYPLGVAVFG